jgi:hypothetical protein
MANAYSLQLIGVTPFTVIDNIPYAIWSYRLDWSAPANWLSGLSSAANVNIEPERLALELSRRIPILDPSQYPKVYEIQSTRLEKPAAGDVQFVYREFQAPPVGPVSYCFVAPAEQDTFCPVRLLHRSAAQSVWDALPFKVNTAGPDALQQVTTGPSVKCPSKPSPGSDPKLLEHSARYLQKATHVPLDVAGTTDLTTRAKLSFVRQLHLQPAELAALDRDLGPNFGASSGVLMRSLKALLPLGGSSATAASAILKNLSQVTIEELQVLGEALVQRRQSRAVTSGSIAASPLEFPNEAYAGVLLRAAVNATQSLRANATLLAAPMGLLNLERLEMTPAGIERGELIATIPLAPLEETAVVQKEWSVTSKEFTSIVTDSLENYSESGVTDNTELAQSTTSQAQHANQFNITGTITGGIPVINGSASSSFAAQDSASQSATESRKQSQLLTSKASSRVKQEHKVTISTTTVTGTSESTTRNLKNASATDPIRIDYFSMMRNWRVRLYRYGLRLTYDIVIPEPAGQLRKAYAYLDSLKSQIGPFKFSVPYFPPDYVKDINDPHFDEIKQWATQFGAQLPAFPVAPPPVTVNAMLDQGMAAGNVSDTPPMPPIDVPAGFWIEHLWIRIRLRNVGAAARVLFTNYPEQVNNDPAGSNFGPDDLTTFGGFMHHVSGQIVLRVSHHDNLNSGVELTAEFSPTDATMAQWLSDAWTALYNAAQTQYYTQQQDIAAKISALEDKLGSVDTLTLRREESEEIMRGALRFLLGVSYEYMDPIVDHAVKTSQGYTDAGGNIVYTTDPPYGVAFTESEVLINGLQLAGVSSFESDVRFINQAIEWENVGTFLYSYFWDMPESWSFIRQITHPDATRQAFLRAGSARVVLTVRKGWEAAWTSYIDGTPPGESTPRLTIAQEIAAYDDRNYPGIPPANPGRSVIRLEDAVYSTSATQLSPPSPSIPLQDVEIEVESSAGFLAGAQVVIDSQVHINATQTQGWQEATTISAVRDRHLTLSQVQYAHGGDNTSYAVVQPGEKGVLIAEWNEYTPTSGTDIAVTSNLATIA